MAERKSNKPSKKVRLTRQEKALRDQFAMAALASRTVQDWSDFDNDWEFLAQAAYLLADAMLKERLK